MRFANAARILVGPSSGRAARRPVVCTQSVAVFRTATTIVVVTHRKGVQPLSYPGEHAPPPSSYPYRRAVQNVYVPDDAILLSPLKRVGVWLARPSVSVFLTPPVTDVSAGRLLLLYSLHLLNTAAAAAAAVSQYQDPIFVVVSA